MILAEPWKQDAWHATEGHTGKHQDRSGGRGRDGKWGQEPSLWFPLEGEGKAGWSSIRLGQFERFQQPWAVGAVPNPLGPGPG